MQSKQILEKIHEKFPIITTSTQFKVFDLKIWSLSGANFLLLIFLQEQGGLHDAFAGFQVFDCTTVFFHHKTIQEIVANSTVICHCVWAY